MDLSAAETSNTTYHTIQPWYEGKIERVEVSAHCFVDMDTEGRPVGVYVID